MVQLGAEMNLNNITDLNTYDATKLDFWQMKIMFKEGKGKCNK